MSNHEQLASLGQDIDKINVRATAKTSEDDRPWHMKPATIISMLALFFSFGTTAFSAYNSHQEEVRANRRDVRALLQRLSKLPIENYEFLEKHKGSGLGENLAGLINQENILLATQAAEGIERYPDSFTSTEYFAVATALNTSNIMGKVPFFLTRAMNLATTANDYNVATRSYAAYLYANGEIEEGRRLFTDAMNVWQKFPVRNKYMASSTELVTLMYWSQAAYAAGNKQEAEAKLAEARQRLSALTPGPFTDSLKNQLDYTAGFVEAITPAGPTAPAHPPDRSPGRSARRFSDRG